MLSTLSPWHWIISFLSPLFYRCSLTPHIRILFLSLTFTIQNRFDIIKKLGQGTYGKVQLGINKETGQEVAIKTIKKSKIETEADLIRIRREVQIMSSVQHPNIIHIYEGKWTEPWNSSVHILMLVVSWKPMLLSWAEYFPHFHSCYPFHHLTRANTTYL